MEGLPEDLEPDLPNKTLDPEVIIDGKMNLEDFHFIFFLIIAHESGHDNLSSLRESKFHHTNILRVGAKSFLLTVLKKEEFSRYETMKKVFEKEVPYFFLDNNPPCFLRK